MTFQYRQDHLETVLVEFIGVDGEGRLVAAEGPVAGPVVDGVILRRGPGLRLVPVAVVTTGVSERQFWLVHRRIGFHRRDVNAGMTGVKTAMWFAANPMKSLYLAMKA